MNCLWEFDVDAIYANISSVFIASEERINEMVGDEVHLGEIAGKHSEVTFELKKDMFRLITDDEEIVEALFQSNGGESKVLGGIDIVGYWEEDQELRRLYGEGE